MKKHLAMLGVLLFLVWAARAENEGDYTHHVCEVIAAGAPLANSEVIAEICNYVAWLEKKCQSPPGDPESTKKVSFASLTPITLQETPINLYAFKSYQNGKIKVLEPMTTLSLGVRLDAGLAPKEGEVLGCTYRNEQYIVANGVKMPRLRIVCKDSEFVITDIIF